MSFDRTRLSAVLSAHGAVVRVVIAEVLGSAPREAGAAMLVWASGQEGTIGGGALEFEATGRARAILKRGGPDRVDRVPLGPSLGQCCGGAVVLLSEIWTAARLAALGEGAMVARPLPGTTGDMPLAVRRLAARARREGRAPQPGIVQGWMVEPIALPEREIWIWGAGHVGRALVAILAPLPGFRITWVDTDAGRFPATLPDGVLQRIAPDPAALVADAPAGAEHLIVTFSHALDLALCHRLLGHGFASAGLIGSESKWARFRSRLAALGHSGAQIARIRCPIGEPAYGKHPQAIAVGVAAEFLRRPETVAGKRECEA
ncbi:MAG: xanthine dehydrogenase accessory protein XdhC [Albidovulum sp.]